MALVFIKYTQNFDRKSVSNCSLENILLRIYIWILDLLFQRRYIYFIPLVTFASWSPTAILCLYLLYFYTTVPSTCSSWSSERDFRSTPENNAVKIISSFFSHPVNLGWIIIMWELNVSVKENISLEITWAARLPKTKLSWFRMILHNLSITIVLISFQYKFS